MVKLKTLAYSVLLTTAFIGCDRSSNTKWDEILNLNSSKTIGINSDLQNKNPVSYYKATTPGIFFDISNNRIQASFSATGKLINLCVVKELNHLTTTENLLPGIQNSRTFYHIDSVSLQLMKATDTLILDKQNHVGVDMLDHLFPVFVYSIGKLDLRLLVFAPITPVIAESPKGIIFVIRAENKSNKSIQNQIRFGDHRINTMTHHTFISFGNQGKLKTSTDIKLKPGEHSFYAFALALGKDVNDMKKSETAIRQLSPIEWFIQTHQILKDQTGELSIPDDPFYAELYIRAKELVRQSGLYMDGINWSGGWLGSDHSSWQKSWIWTKDNYYQILPLCILEPQIAKDAILFFLQKGLASYAYGDRKNRFPNASSITHSLGNAMIPFQLAGIYYMSTADKKYFLSHPELLDSAKRRFDHIVGTGMVDGVHLYPSIQISDGEARGDFHTGSNICLWHAVKAMAQIAREVYNEIHLADEWSLMAEKIRSDIIKYCSGDGLLGEQFFEGANRDGSFIQGHDVEESDVSLMPFYGFCETDDRRLINFARLAMDESNPFYSKHIDGIWWYDKKWYPAAFTGWVSALSAACSEEELRNRLDKLRFYTDVDGSFMWWPYRYGETNPENVARLEGGAPKSGWGAGIYLCHFINDIIGLKLDAPKNHLLLKPFFPWTSFKWDGCRLGNSKFNINYVKEQNRIITSITNLNPAKVSLTTELKIPENSSISEVIINGQITEQYTMTQRYKQLAILIEQEVESNKSFTLVINLN